MKRSLVIAILAISAAAAADPPAAPPPAPPNATDALPPPAPMVMPTPPEKLFGIGYKLGDGIGFLGGDVIINPVPHVSIDLYGTYLPLTASNGENGTAYAFAPAIQGHLFAGRRSTPYAAVGLQYVHATLGDAVASGNGFFANLGYEWKSQSGFGVLLGGGVQYLQKVEATNGTTMVSIGGQLNPNLELGIRYMFL